MKSRGTQILRLSDIPKENIFRVPASYFESLPGEIGNKNVIGLNDELQKLTFEVPSHYFESLTTKINRRIFEERSQFGLESIKSPFNVPENYFETLDENISNQISDLSNVPQNPFVEPSDAYFETLSERVHERIEESSDAKVIALYPKILKYGVAASLFILLTISFYFYTRNDQSQAGKLVEIHPQKNQIDLAQTMIASLSKSEVRQYLEQQNDLESHELLEFTDVDKKDKIRVSFEKDILPEKIKKQEQQNLELELENIDVSDIETDI